MAMPEQPQKMKASLPTPEGKKAFVDITIIANDCMSNGNGTFSLYIPVKELKPETYKLLDELFPTQGKEIDRLLTIEALIANIL